ncbi:MAG: BMC domain-containing protein [Eubacteriales bacterium]|nr:BMC domain-containing protein [Eubacteriales bacterium]
MAVFEDKERVIQEFVPGRQVTLAHVIANPVDELYQKLGIFDVEGAIGIFTLTPSESAIIAADVASKAANIHLGFVDRFSGSLLIYGDVADVKAAVKAVLVTLCDKMHYTPAEVTGS